MIVTAYEGYGFVKFRCEACGFRTALLNPTTRQQLAVRCDCHKARPAHEGKEKEESPVSAPSSLKGTG